MLLPCGSPRSAKSDAQQGLVCNCWEHPCEEVRLHEEGPWKSTWRKLALMRVNQPHWKDSPRVRASGESQAAIPTAACASLTVGATRMAMNPWGPRTNHPDSVPVPDGARPLPHLDRESGGVVRASVQHVCQVGPVWHGVRMPRDCHGSLMLLPLVLACDSGRKGMLPNAGIRGRMEENLLLGRK